MKSPDCHMYLIMYTHSTIWSIFKIMVNVTMIWVLHVTNKLPHKITMKVHFCFLTCTCPLQSSKFSPCNFSSLQIVVASKQKRIELLKSRLIKWWGKVCRTPWYLYLAHALLMLWGQEPFSDWSNSLLLWQSPQKRCNCMWFVLFLWGWWGITDSCCDVKTSHQCDRSWSGAIAWECTFK